MRKWYCNVEYFPTSMSIVTIRNNYSRESGVVPYNPSPPVQSKPVVLDPFHIEELVPEAEYMTREFCNLCFNRLGGLSGMREEHLWAWLREANRGEYPDTYQWEMVVGLIQATVCEGTLQKSAPIRLSS